MKFKDVKVGQKIKLGSLIWTKIDPVTNGPWKSQNIYYKYPDSRINVSHTDCIDDETEVEVVE